MKALGLVVSDKKIFENFILKTYSLTLWPIYATNWNGLNNFDRGPPRDHSCEVWSKSNERLKRRCRLKKLLTDGQTDARTMDDGQWAITKAHLKTKFLIFISFSFCMKRCSQSVSNCIELICIRIHLSTLLWQYRSNSHYEHKQNYL